MRPVGNKVTPPGAEAKIFTLSLLCAQRLQSQFSLRIGYTHTWEWHKGAKFSEVDWARVL